jgi:hypothetical protein
MLLKSILTLPALLLAASAALAQSHAGKIDWVTDPEVGLAKAKAEGKCAMLFFTADW